MNIWTGAGLAAAMAGGGILASMWGRIRGVMQNLYSRLVVTVELNRPLDRAMRSYLHAQFSKSRFGIRCFSAMTAFVRPKRRWEMVPFETTGKQTSTYWFGWRPLWVQVCHDSDRDPNESTQISFMRGLFNTEKLVLQATEHWNHISSGVGFLDWGHDMKRFQIVRIFGTGGQGERHNTVKSGESNDNRASELKMFEHRLMGYGREEIGPELHDGAALDMLALSPSVEHAVEEAKRWVDSEEWFRKRGVPWRRGWLLHGPPGTGKTSVVRAIAEDLDLPVYLYDLASLSNREFVQAWAEMLEQAPCIALMEDLDAVFEGRANKLGESGGGLTFDCLLNTIDGVERCDGLFTVITTNQLNTLDPAIGVVTDRNETGDMPARPGRVDRVIEMGNLTEVGRRKLANRILADWPEEIEEIVNLGDGDTGAQFQERAMRIAVTRFWLAQDDAEHAEKELATTLQ